MTTDEYGKQILSVLLKKHRDRMLRGNANSGRRVSAGPEAFFRDYGRNTADIGEKQRLTAAADALEAEGFITVKRLKYSNDLVKIYLCADRTGHIEEYMRNRYGYVSMDAAADEVFRILKTVPENGSLTACYAARISETLSSSARIPDAGHVKEMMTVLSFLEHNDVPLYLREASVLALGHSKRLEEILLHEVCSVIRAACAGGLAEDSTDEDCLALFSVVPADREIMLKGPWILEWETFSPDVSRMKGGISVSGNDIADLKNIRVPARNIMTVENKTSFLRMPADMHALMYLGGFAGTQQIQFLKKAFACAPGKTFLHFGDIDIGGFLIHRHLTSRTGIPFELYRMGITELQDQRFAHALRALTENDRTRAQILLDHPLYHEPVAYMLANNVKLEQEIVSYYDAGK